jgi:ZIP family zinc transporter
MEDFKLVILTALGVGGATVFGGLIGFFVKGIPPRLSGLTLSFAGGIMLSAAIWGLMIPAIGEGGPFAITLSSSGILSGAVFIGVCQRLVPRLRFMAGDGFENGEADRVLCLVMAMAVHNFPEGVAAGVSLGSHDLGGALAVAGGIALQNIPEGMAVIPPMLSAGIKRRRALALALVTGATEVAGTFFGYRAVTLLEPALPFALSFAGGAMLFVIVDGMIPEASEAGKGSAYVFCLGFCAMLFMSLVL